MTSNVRQLRPERNEVPLSTYGALAEANVTALEGLLSEVRRTYSHVMWLENYVAELPPTAVFEGQQFHITQINQWEASGKWPKPNTVNWLLAVEQAKKLGVPTKRRPEVHLAVQQLFKERQQLVAVCAQAIRAGIALDEIELAKQHGELLVTAMTKFAEAVGLDPTSKDVVTAILSAMDEVSGPST